MLVGPCVVFVLFFCFYLQIFMRSYSMMALYQAPSPMLGL